MDPSHFRRAGRRPIGLALRFRAGLTLAQQGSATDLSLRGAFISTSTPPDPGAHVTLSISTPTAWQPLELAGYVRWVRNGRGGEPPGFGVEFDRLSAVQARSLHELIELHGLTEPTW